ncbi:hypothetical protein SAMN05518672_108172 [Chitinophaga sp. CF118]|uniref:hypothetical protein n=1 Tax=Chitinophaga sp. CF118 TaxID=1884367 RepID=UPI0008E10B58|nr:hypothetical protein [Chitinophaga sp. CF118]SFE63129.1 hypothetical protein SAMN05518672_108172 [Chitinophaga sp. CF118]
MIKLLNITSILTLTPNIQLITIEFSEIGLCLFIKKPAFYYLRYLYSIAIGALLMLFLFSDVTEFDAPTKILKGLHIIITSGPVSSQPGC